MDPRKNIPFGEQEVVRGQGPPPQPGVQIVRQLVPPMYIEDDTEWSEILGIVPHQYQINHLCMGFKIQHMGPSDGPALDIVWLWLGTNNTQGSSGRLAIHQQETFDLQSLKGWVDTRGKDSVLLTVQIAGIPPAPGAVGTQHYKIWVW